MIFITFSGEKHLILRLEEAIKVVGSPKKVLEEIGTVLVDEFTDNFPSENTRLGNRWTPLAERTLREKARLGYGNEPILVRTGNLMRGFRKKVESFSVRVFNEVPYGVYHQFGGPNLPKREVMSMPGSLKEKILLLRLLKKEMKQKCGKCLLSPSIAI